MGLSQVLHVHESRDGRDGNGITTVSILDQEGLRLEPLFYFAYGSNMDLNQVIARGLQTVSHQPGRLDGYCLAFNKLNTRVEGAAHANVVQRGGGVVEGVLFKLSSPDAIAQMDPYEGVPTRYRRVIVDVESKGELLSAWTYIAQPAYVREGLLPTRDYLAKLLAGRSFLSESYWRELSRQPSIEDG